MCSVYFYKRYHPSYVFSYFSQAAIKSKLQELGAYIGKCLKCSFFISEAKTNKLNFSSVMYVLTILPPTDEELPDYIMVMVANKKTSQQMADDLSLFLGSNTIKFTAWYDQNNA